MSAGSNAYCVGGPQGRCNRYVRFISKVDAHHERKSSGHERARCLAARDSWRCCADTPLCRTGLAVDLSRTAFLCKRCIRRTSFHGTDYLCKEKQYTVDEYFACCTIII